MHKTRKNYNKRKNYDTKICNENMTFQECELEILRNAVDETEEIKNQKIINNEDIKKMLSLVENFIIEKKLMLYGGTAINNLLPKYAQFYNRDIEVPDYDCYSPDALNHTKELADIFYREGYVEVEAKSGVHMGTFKIFVNFISIIDITQMHNVLYNSLIKESIVISEMHYTPPDYLRMSMYLELSRPNGDVSRWEKIFKRLLLLNKHYPLKINSACDKVDFHINKKENSSKEDELYIETRENFINQGVVFFGGYAASLYSKYMPYEKKILFRRYPYFDVLSEEPEKTAIILKEHLTRLKIKHIKFIYHEQIGEIIPYHIEIRVNEKSIAFIYKPIACHSYNKIIIREKEINIATIDTILAFYLSFIYANMKYYDKNRLLCMAKYLFDVEEHNRLNQKGILKRFSINCYGKQQTLEEIRSEKAMKYKELIKNNNKKEYEMWFLKYSPYLKHNKNKSNIPNKKIEESINIIEKKIEDENNIKKKKKKREQDFIKRFIGRIKTRKNRKSEFLF
jgi:hypothetical protein